MDEQKEFVTKTSKPSKTFSLSPRKSPLFGKGTSKPEVPNTPTSRGELLNVATSVTDGPSSSQSTQSPEDPNKPEDGNPQHQQGDTPSPTGLRATRQSGTSGDRRHSVVGGAAETSIVPRHAISTLREHDVQVSVKDKCMIQPNGSFRKSWDVVQALLVIYVACVVPIRVGFDVPAQGGMYVIELVIDIYFIVDLILNFYYPYRDPVSELFITDHKAIAKRYLQGWFIIDFLASIPMVLIQNMITGSSSCIFLGHCNDAGGNQPLKAFRILRLMRMTRVLRVFRLARLLDHYHDDLLLFMRAGPILKTIAILLLLCHLSACIFYYFSQPEFRMEIERVAIVEGQIKPWLVKEFGSDYANASMYRRYIACLYWSFATITTVGYGDVSATTVAERIVSIVIIIIGVAYFSYVVGNVSSLIAQLQRSHEAYNYKLELVRNFCIDTKLPKSIRKPVFQFFKGQCIPDYDSRILLAELPFNLRSEILKHLYSPIISSLPLFQGCNYTFATEVCARLKLVFYEKGAIVCMRGEIGKEMYILTSGNLEVVELKEAGQQMLLRPGEYFGEGAVLGDCTRSSTIQAATNCTLCVIKADDMAECLKGFPEMKPRLIEFYLKHKESIRMSTPIHSEKSIKIEQDELYHGALPPREESFSESEGEGQASSSISEPQRATSDPSHESKSFLFADQKNLAVIHLVQKVANRMEVVEKDINYKFSIVARKADRLELMISRLLQEVRELRPIPAIDKEAYNAWNTPN